MAFQNYLQIVNQLLENQVSPKTWASLLATKWGTCTGDTLCGTLLVAKTTYKDMVT